MKIVQAVPRVDAEDSLKTLLKQKERELRGGTTAFRRKREGVWVHAKHRGTIKWDTVAGGVLLAEIRASGETKDWQLIQSFVGYLDRHLGEELESISILYR